MGIEIADVVRITRFVSHKIPKNSFKLVYLYKAQCQNPKSMVRILHIMRAYHTLPKAQK